MSGNPRVSVVIATFGREGVLCDTLRRVLAEPGENKEIVVVDQTPEHEAATREYLEKIAPRIRYIRMDHPNLTEAENRGIREASGDIVLFLDDDVAFEAGLIDAHVRNYADERVGGVAGLVLERGREPTKRLPAACTAGRFGYFFFRHDYSGRVRVANVAEGNASFRRQGLLDVGLIDERFRENAYLWGMDLSRRVVEAGWKIVHDPAARVLHLRHGSGGVRMKTIRPTSYFRNLFYYLARHADRHSAFSIAARMFFYRVLVDGRRRPWVIPVNAWTFAKAWWLQRPASK